MRELDEVIEIIAEEHLMQRYHGYAGGGMQWGTSVASEAKALGLAYRITKAEVSLKIEQSIQIKCMVKNCRDFSSLR